IYIGDIESFSLTNSYIHDAVVGHEVKSRAENNTITGNVIADNNGTASYEIDLPNGGNANIANNVVQQGPNSQNPNIITYGEEGNLHSGTTLSVTGNTIINDEGRGPALRNNTSSTATFTNNSVYGFGGNSLVSGPATQSGTNVLSARPSFEEAVPVISIPAPTTTTPVQSPTPVPTPAPGSDTIVVNAYASLAGGVGAHFALIVDGATVGDATVNSTSTQAYSFNTTLVGGSSIAHDIRVLFDNDAVINGQDRNLYLQSISVDGQTTAATDSHEVYHATGSASSGFGPGDLAGSGNMYWQGAAEFTLPAMLK
ncbi:MAG: carbohydrate-binding domain-containing protein, partial [Janthinobacterium lividum]